MGNKEITSKLRNLIAHDKINEAINNLMSYSRNLENKEIYENAIILASRFHRLKEMDIKGLIDESYSNSNMSRLRYDILKLTERLEESEAILKSEFVVKLESKDFSNIDKSELIEKLSKLLDLSEKDIKIIRIEKG